MGSQGALPVARALLARVPDDFPAAIVYAQHRSARCPSVLVDLLSYHARLPVRAAADGDAVRPGTIYVAPPDGQTIVSPARTFAISEGRCLGDPLLASVAGAYGPAALGVILSGRLRDGAEGLRQIKRAGGRGLIQDPAGAESDGMPLAAMSTGCYDFVLTPQQLHSALIALVTVPGAADLLGVRAHPAAAA